MNDELSTPYQPVHDPAADLEVVTMHRQIMADAYEGRRPVFSPRAARTYLDDIENAVAAGTPLPHFPSLLSSVRNRTTPPERWRVPEPHNLTTRLRFALGRSPLPGFTAVQYDGVSAYLHIESESTLTDAVGRMDADSVGVEFRVPDEPHIRRVLEEYGEPDPEGLCWVCFGPRPAGLIERMCDLAESCPEGLELAMERLDVRPEAWVEFVSDRD